MDVEAAYMHPRGGGVEVLPGDLALGPAVRGEGRAGLEALRLEALHAAPDLFVRREADGDRPVRAGGQQLQKRHYLRNARLVVRAEQRVARGGDKRPSGEGGQMREVAHGEGAAAAELDVAAVVIRYHAGLHALAGEVGRGVHMRDEAYGLRALAARRRRQARVDIAALRALGVRRAESPELLDERVRKLKLPLRAGVDLHGLVALRGIGHVFQKPLVCAHVYLLPERYKHSLL